MVGPAILAALSGIANAMEIVTFIQFIQEEAIQTSSLGTFLALRNGSYRGAALGINRTRLLVSYLRDVNDWAGWIAPYSKYCFADFCDAVDTNLEIYDDILLTKIKAGATLEES